MKDTMINITKLVYPDLKTIVCADPNLEEVLVALSKKYPFTIGIILNIVTIYNGDEFEIEWQLTKTLTQQSESTQETIKQIFEDGK